MTDKKEPENYGEVSEAILRESIEDGEQLMEEMAAYTRKLKRRNDMYMGITIGIIIGLFLWMIYIFGWVV